MPAEQLGRCRTWRPRPRRPTDPLRGRGQQPVNQADESTGGDEPDPVRPPANEDGERDGGKGGGERVGDGVTAEVEGDGGHQPERTGGHAVEGGREPGRAADAADEWLEHG